MNGERIAVDNERQRGLVASNGLRLPKAIIDGNGAVSPAMITVA